MPSTTPNAEEDCKPLWRMAISPLWWRMAMSLCRRLSHITIGHTLIIRIGRTLIGRTAIIRLYHLYLFP